MNHCKKLRAVLFLGLCALTANVATFAGALTADLSITKTDNVSTATPGGQLTYTITASNAGPDDVTGATVVDTFPAALMNCSTTCAATPPNACTAGPVMGNLNDTMVDLVNGGSVVYTAVCDIDPMASGNLSNTASISSAAMDPTPANDAGTDGTLLIFAPNQVPANAQWALILLLMLVATVAVWHFRKAGQKL